MKQKTKFSRILSGLLGAALLLSLTAVPALAVAADQYLMSAFMGQPDPQSDQHLSLEGFAFQFDGAQAEDIASSEITNLKLTKDGAPVSIALLADVEKVDQPIAREDGTEEVLHQTHYFFTFAQPITAPGAYELSFDYKEQTYTCLPETLGAGAQQLDTASAWAKDAIVNAITMELVPAALQGKYTQNITRAEFSSLAIAYVEAQSGKAIDAYLTEKGLTVDSGVFSDSQDQNVLAANALGIVGGVGGGKFDPAGEITREQAAAMLMRAQKAVDTETAGAATSAFADSGSVASWAADGVNYVSAAGIMGGVGNNRFDPQGTYTREQAIVTFMRMFEK